MIKKVSIRTSEVIHHKAQSPTTSLYSPPWVQAGYADHNLPLHPHHFSYSSLCWLKLINREMEKK